MIGKMKIKNKMSITDKLKIAGILLLFFIGVASVLYALIMQFILSYERFGVIISRNIFIPHWSAWFYLGVIPMMISWWLAENY